MVHGGKFRIGVMEGGVEGTLLAAYGLGERRQAEDGKLDGAAPQKGAEK